ncbi:MAG TPA: hypothetical protein VNO21_00060, partial [Polyangiaceae bacterium]|nr:hypothetical protein [Polyangiaceae bacterium]
MATRETRTTWPIWLAVVLAAVQIHWDVWKGGVTIGEIHNDHNALADLGDLVRERVRTTEQTFDIVVDTQ